MLADVTAADEITFSRVAMRRKNSPSDRHAPLCLQVPEGHSRIHPGGPPCRKITRTGSRQHQGNRNSHEHPRVDDLHVDIEVGTNDRAAGKADE